MECVVFAPKARRCQSCAAASAAGPVMEAGRNVKLPVQVCARYTDAVSRPPQSRMGGGLVLPLQNI